MAPEYEDRVLLPPAGDDAKRLDPDQVYAFIAENLLTPLLHLYFPEDLRASRILLIPGNHDLERSEDATAVSWATFGQFASDWYRDDPSGAYPIAPTEGRVGASWVIDYSADLGLRCILLNGYAGMARSAEIPAGASVRQSGFVGENERNEIDKILTRLGANRSCPTIALVHHHLFPALSSDSGRVNVLVDFPEVYNWLADHDCRLVLHGHRHMPYFAQYRREGFPAGLFGKLDEAAGARLTSMVVSGVGRCRVEDELRKRDGDPQLQVLRVYLESQGIHGMPVVSTPYAQVGEVWRNRPQGGSQARLFSADVPDGRRLRHESERFIADSISVRSLPAMAELIMAWEDSKDSPAQFWFWRHSADIYEELIQKYGYAPEAIFENLEPRVDLTTRVLVPRQTHPGQLPLVSNVELPSDVYPPRSARDVYLFLLIQRLNRWNRRRAVYGMMPGQLYGLYALGAMLFGRARIEELAANEFQRDEWKEQLRSSRYPDAGRRLTSHLDEANRRIAREVGEWYESERSSLENRASPLTIIDVGFGALKTARWVVDELRQRGFDARSIRYIGVDINSSLVEDAASRIHGMAEFSPIVAEESAGYMLECYSIEEWLDKPIAFEIEGEADIVLASYSLHHTGSRETIRRGFIDGTLPMFLLRFLGDTVEEPVRNQETALYRAVFNGFLFEDIPVEWRKDAALRLCEVVRRYREAGHSWTATLPPDAQYVESVGAFVELLPDARSGLFHGLTKLLRSGGLVAIADPNGFSRTFNRQHVIHDWPLVASNFEEWTTVVQRLGDLSYEQVSVWRQMRRTDLSVVSVPVDSEIVEHLSAGGEVREEELVPLFDDLPGEAAGGGVDAGSAVDAIQPLEVEDFHLGYIITATKGEISDPGDVPLF